MSSPIAQYFTKKFQGMVWRIYPNTPLNQLLLEIRGVKDKFLQFYQLPLNSPKNIQLLTIPFDWWTGVEYHGGKYTIFHGFADVSLPGHRGIKVFDSELSKVLWEESSFIFHDYNSDGQLICTLAHSSYTKYLNVNIETGEIIGEQSTYPSQIQQEDSKHIIYFEDSPYFPELKTFIHSKTGDSTVSCIEYEERSSHVVLSYYIGTGNKISNKLIVTDNDGNVLVCELLGEGLPGIASSSFTLLNTFLLTVRNKNELLIYNLV